MSGFEKAPWDEGDLILSHIVHEYSIYIYMFISYYSKNILLYIIYNLYII